MLRGQGSADSGADRGGSALDQIGAVQEGEQAAGDGFGVARALHHDGEFVAGEAADDVGVAQGGGESFGDEFEQGVAEGMAAAVEDGPGAIEVDEEDRGFGGDQGQREPFVEPGGVG